MELKIWDYDGCFETKERDEWKKLTDRGTFVGYKYYQTDKNGCFKLEVDAIGSITCLFEDYAESINKVSDDKVVKTIFKNKRVKVVCEFAS
jgi:hypothetical protein